MNYQINDSDSSIYTGWESLQSDLSLNETASLSDVDKKINSLMNMINVLKQGLEQTQLLNDRKIEVMKNETSEQLNADKEKFSKFEFKIGGLESKNAALETQIVEVMAKNASFKKELEDMQKKLDHLTAENAQYKAEKIELEKEIALLNQLNAVKDEDLKYKDEQLEKASQKKIELKKEICLRNKKIEEKTQEIESLKSQLQLSKKEKLEALMQLDEKTAELESEKDGREAEREQASKQLVEEMERTRIAESKLSNLQREADLGETRYLQMRDALDTAVEAQNELKTTLSQIENVNFLDQQSVNNWFRNIANKLQLSDDLRNAVEERITREYSTLVARSNRMPINPQHWVQEPLILNLIEDVLASIPGVRSLLLKNN
ncbi:MAG: hypothetical protein K0S07_491 [Chlamydiales bacterium]|jgi:chromosome segregation ATPase|nr:hypothetical protein [Chlamydiales bacterium]